MWQVQKTREATSHIAGGSAIEASKAHLAKQLAATYARLDDKYSAMAKPNLGYNAVDSDDDDMARVMRPRHNNRTRE